MSQTVSTTLSRDQKLHHATFDDDIETLLVQIGQGLIEDDASNLEKLKIAQDYGPVLLQLKKVVPHGQFKKVLKDRFPRISYSKCNRWMVIAKNASQVAEALKTHPDIAWGPKKMVDFLAGNWKPETDLEDDEDDCLGYDSEEPIESSQHSDVSFNPAESLEDEEEDSDLFDADPRTQKKWEEVAANAESEAKLTGKSSMVPAINGKVIVKVFSQEDHDAIEDCLSEWLPKTTPIYRQDGVSTLTASVMPQQIADVLLLLGNALKKSLPSHLNVSVEL